MAAARPSPARARGATEQVKLQSSSSMLVALKAIGLWAAGGVRLFGVPDGYRDRWDWGEVVGWIALVPGSEVEGIWSWVGVIGAICIMSVSCIPRNLRSACRRSPTAPRWAMMRACRIPAITPSSSKFGFPRSSRPCHRPTVRTFPGHCASSGLWNWYAEGGWGLLGRLVWQASRCWTSTGSFPSTAYPPLTLTRRNWTQTFATFGRPRGHLDRYR